MKKKKGLYLRHELKYYIDPAQHCILRGCLSDAILLEPHAGPDSRYRIRNLYFDDFKNTVPFEKQVGVARCKKYRMHIYDYCDMVIKLK